MTTILAYLVPFLFNWLIFFVVCYIVVEYGQTYFYDESTPNVLAKVALGSGLLALLMLWTKTSYDTMFTEQIAKTVVLAVVAFGVFTLIFRFQPWHGLGIGLATVLLMAGFATMAISSFADRNRVDAPSTRVPAKPLRRTTTTPTILPAGAKAVKPAAR